MEANELKIGNLINSPYGVSTIYGVNKDCIQIEIVETIYDFDLDEINPIPITEEWLLDLGFTRQPWGLTKDGLLFKDPKLDCKNLVLEIGNGHRTQIKYIHELQNLYFALTGEELEIKLKT